MTTLLSNAKRVVGTARELKHLTGVGREAVSHIDAGVHGQWKVTLAADGIPAERREYLVDTMSARQGVQPRGPIGDGKLRIIGWFNSTVSVHTGAIHALGQFADNLSQAGMNPSELLAGDIEFTLEPTDNSDAPPTPARQATRLGLTVGRLIGGQRTLRRMERFEHGLTVAVAENFDHAAMRATGELSFDVVVVIENLTDDEFAAMAPVGNRLFGSTAALDEDGDLTIIVRANKVGTGLGALLLVTRRMADLIELIPAHATLDMFARQAENDSAEASVSAGV